MKIRPTVRHKGFENPIMDEDYRMLLLKVSQNMERLRLENGFTQEKMRDLGFEKRFYQRCESGKYAMSFYTLFRLAQTFRVPIQQFFVEVKEPEIRLTFEIPKENPMQVLRQLNPRNFLK